ncbi:hypothetical protein T12_4048 [Trichinella patagoniensis]|uniref:Uncharacterized protein n=1 Tax=Trichinella patagoniensis TaxID=990121 RepID=A0A0V0ZH19_9BILA|nr:hypothetical protein T12_4048 [Trichinella patagoniensis]
MPFADYWRRSCILEKCLLTHSNQSIALDDDDDDDNDESPFVMHLPAVRISNYRCPVIVNKNIRFNKKYLK